jgi:hypothetical protein
MGEDGGMDFVSRLDRAVEQFADLVATGDLAAPVPSCPGWTFADLVGCWRGTVSGRLLILRLRP